MAIRKPRPAGLHHKEAAHAEAPIWPYSISETTVQVRPDGSIMIPAAFARLLAAEAGDAVLLRMMSDGHLEADSEYGRSSTGKPSGKRYSTEEFMAHLEEVAEAAKPE